MSALMKFLLYTGLSVFVAAQSLDTITNNTQQLQVVMTFDQNPYFPGEAALMTITVKNPTSTSMTVFAPFSNECLRLYTPNTDGSLSRLGADGCNGTNTVTSPTTVFAAGEQRMFKLNSFDGWTGSGMGISPWGTPGVPQDPGSYVLGNSYAATTAPFSVVQPSLETAAVIQVQDEPDTDPTTGDTTPLPQYVHIFSLRWNNQSYLCVAQPQSNASPASVNALGTLDLPAVYKRIATSANRITSISPTADASGNLTIVWKDSTGAQFTSNYPANGGDTTPPQVISYRVFFGSQAFELNTSTRSDLPWQITGIEVAFSKPIATATVNSIAGVTATTVSGLNTNTLFWAINPVTSGTASTVLLGSGPNAILDASGNALGGGQPYSQSFTVLFGDVNGDGVQNSTDLNLISSVIQATPYVYNIFADINGDGVVNNADGQILVAIEPSVTVSQVLTRDSSTNNIVAVVTCSNSGAAGNVQITVAQINNTSSQTSLPVNLGTIAAGGSAQATLIFPASAGTSGSPATITYNGTYAGPFGHGSFNTGSAVLLP